MKKFLWLVVGSLWLLIAGGVYAAPTYPVKMSANKRYLVDQNNVPFLMYGDSPQGIMAVNPTDQETYMAGRQAIGMNTVWADAVCSPYSGICPNEYTYDGSSVPPFLGKLADNVTWDISKPNDAYFQRTDAMLNRAATHGMTVLLGPLETGWWLPTLVANGTTRATTFGTYLGNRYKNFPNIIWLSGNDFQDWSNTTSDAVVKAVASGIKAADPNHLQTVELDYDTSGSLDDSTWSPIINLDTSYSYYPQYDQTLIEYNRTGNLMPVYFIEGVYEFQSYQGGYKGPYQLRNQEYWTQLSGSTGQLYGNANMFGFVSGWQSSNWASTPGINEFKIWNDFFKARNWWELVPDQNHTVVTAGYGTYQHCTSPCLNADSTYATTARSADGSLVITYLPVNRTISVDMTKMSGSTTARWFDPTTGNYSAIGTFTNTGSQQFTPPPTAHTDGTHDWVLILQNLTILGDANGDGVVSVADLQYELRNWFIPFTSVDYGLTYAHL